MSDRVASLDTTVADRQAIGASYTRPHDLESSVDLHFRGVLRLAAHPDFTGDVTDWSANPFQDNNWQFQHHSFRWVNPLRWAAVEGNAAARTEWLRIARSWFDANVPERTAASSFAWRNMSDGNRAIHLSLGAPLVPADATWFVDLLEAHRDRLMEPANIVHKNHGMHQHAGLLVVGATLRDREAMETATRRIHDQFLVTFDDEGSDDEGAIGYHQLNILWWRELWERARREGFEQPAAVEERLHRATYVLAQIALPDGQLPQIGDTVRGSVQAGLGPLTDYVRSRGVDGERPTGNAMVLRRGYIVSRSGWGENRPLQKESHAIVRYGEAIHGHSHEDRGSVHIYAAGSRWLVDGGFHSYQTRHPTRLHLRSRAAHNVASLIGTPHIDVAEVELEQHSITDAVHDFTLLDHGYPGAEMRRRVIYLTGPDCWLIWDATAPTNTAKLTQRWQVEPGVTVRGLDRGYRLMKSGASLTMTWLGHEPQLRFSRALKGRLEGWVGVKWKAQEAGSLLFAESTTSGRQQLVTLIAPSGDAPLGLVSSRVGESGPLVVELVRGGKWWRAKVGPDGVSVSEK